MEPALLHLVYKITNKLNGYYYIGIHSTYDIDDGYMGSGTKMKQALKIFGPANFDREILSYVDDRETAFKEEKKLIRAYIIENPNCYNIIHTGQRPIYSEDARQLIFKHNKPFDKNFEYKVDLLRPVKLVNTHTLTSFGKAFWGIIAGDTILNIITDLYNDAVGNNLANKYIALLERLPVFKNNIAIYRYEKTTLV